MNTKPTYSELLKENERLQRQINDQKNQSSFTSQLQQLSKIGSWELDLDSLILTLSPETSFIIGLEAIENSFPILSFAEDYVHIDDVLLFKNQLNTALQNRNNKKFTDKFIYRSPIANGDIKYLRIAYSFKSKDILLGVTIDITEQVEAQETLKKERDLFSKGPVSVLVWGADENWPILNVSKNIIDILGYSPSELMHSDFRFASIIHKDDIKKVGEEVSYYIDHNIDSFEQSYRLLTKNNGYKWFYDFTKLIRDKQGKVVEIRGYIYDQTLFKEADIALKKSNSKFQLLANNTYDWEYWRDQNHKYIYISSSCKRISGYKSEEFINNPNLIIDLVREDYRNFVRTHYHDEKNKEKPICQLEFPILNKDGKEIWIEHNCSPVFDGNGDFVGRRGNNRDITEKRKANTKIAENQANLTALIENTDDMIWAIDTDYKLITANTKFLKNAEPLYGKLLKKGNLLIDVKILPKEIYKEWKTYYDQALSGNRQVKELITGTKENPTYSEISFNPIYNKDEVIGLSAIGRDISIRKKVERDLLYAKKKTEESEARFRAISEQATEGITLADMKGNYIFVNPAFCKMTGYSEQELLKMTVFELAGNNEQKVIHKELFNITTEFVLKRKNGSEFPIQIVVNDIVIGSENFLLGMVTDITYRKNTENDLVIARKNIEKSEKKFRELFEKSGDANLIIENGLFIDCNQTTVDMLGYKNKQEVINTHPSVISPKKQFDGKASMEKADKMMQIALKNGTHRFEWDHKKSDGSIIPVEVLLTRLFSSHDKYILYAVWRNISERKKAIQDLRFAKEDAEESERKLHTLIGNLQGVVYRCKNDTDWTMEYLSRGVYDLTGYKVNELTGPDQISWLTIIHPDYREDVWSQVQQAIDNRKAYSLEFKIVCANGAEKTILEQGQGVFENDKLLALEGFITDISDQKKNKQELILAKEKAEENEMQFRAITEQSTEGISVADLDGKYVFVNPSFCKMSGYSSEELLKLTVFDMKAKNQPHESFYDSKEKMEGVPILVNLQKKDGTEYLTEIIGKMISINKQQLVLGTIRDVSERVKKEQEVIEAKDRAEKSEEQFRAIVDQSPLSIQIFDKTGLTIHANTAWENIWNATKDNAINKYNVFDDTYAEELGWLKYLRKAFNGETVFLPDMEYDPKKGGHQGRKRTLKCIAFPILIKDKVEQVILIHQDITQIKKNELDLVKAKEKAEEGDRLKSAFLANMSHEIRTPMNGIMGFTSLLKESDISEDEKIRFIEVIERSGFQLLGIINDLIDISKIESGTIEVLQTKINLKEQMEYLSAFFTPEIQIKGMQLCFDNGDEDINIKTDKEKFLAILTNLIKNAIKYSDNGSINYGYKRNEKHIEFYVTDTGVGISKDQLLKIFDRFTQADNHLSKAVEGAGLGLTITKAYIELLGGEIWVESELGKGSAFYFTLPV